ncbi:multidrug resistance-associated protein 1-like isoform X2 [Stylophora pistillata]|uniref:multidrug resistance-associated protein 1-like isoform X2 n=1 Tax=Stylophora pistillata TaxID=50429 RepID=UPI000C0469DD|nr:multidrug resistance-associated protein 1-like isoform X2 [Stylophora pistillata]
MASSIVTAKKVRVVAIQDFNPLHADGVLTQECLENPPDIQAQLPLSKGQSFEILTKSIKSCWLYVRCLLSQKEGFIPSILCAPLREDVDDNKIHYLSTGGQLSSSMVNLKMESKFFPNILNVPNISSKKIVSKVESMIESKRKPCPEVKANIFSRLSFWWLNSLILTGFKRTLLDSDLWSLEEESLSHNIVPRLHREWDKELRKCHRNGALCSNDQDFGKHHLQTASDVAFHGKCREPSLVKAMIRVFAPYFVIAIFFKLMNGILLFVQPYLLGLLIDYTEDKGNDAERWKGYVYVIVIVTVATIQMTAVQHALHIAFKSAMRVHTSIVGVVYAKALSLNSLSRRITTTGETVNFMAVDAQRLMQLVETLNQLWSAPFQICVAIYFLYVTMGVAVLAGLGMLLLLVPLNLLITRLVRKIQVKQMANADERIRVMNEVLSGIKVLKLYAWEESFMNKIISVRDRELHHLANSMYLGAAVSFTFICAPFLVSLATFTVYVLLGNELTAKKAFVAISLFNILRFPLMMLPRVIVNVIQAQVSFHRLEQFLRLDELQYENVQRKMPSHCSELAIFVKNGAFCWDRNDEVPVLRNINLSIPTGSLVAVVGPVGCGKSTLLSALLGETDKRDGKVFVQGTTAYVPQQAWIQNATLQENVLFGNPRDSVRYKQVISACALEPDIQVLPAEDMTEIGEKGINLSGGQKQRVSLARAVYFNTDIYLLDDPLSAVDSHVGKRIFDEVIGPQGLLKEKTRVLVTHGIQFLPYADQIIVLRDGEVCEVGTYTDLKSSQGWFAEFLDTYAGEKAGEQMHKGNMGEVSGHGKSLLNGKKSRNVAYNRSVSCHHLGNELHPRHQAAKSQSEVNLARLVVEKQSGNQSPLKKLQYLENRHSFVSLLSLNSLLSGCEGLDANYAVEDEPIFDNANDEDEAVSSLGVPPNFQHQRSVVSGVSVNSLLSLVEEDIEDRVEKPPVIFINEPEDSPSIREKENESLLAKEGNVERENIVEKREKKGKAGRTTSDERSQTGRVKFSVIWAYAGSLGIICSFLILLSGFAGESAIIMSRIWLAEWSSTNVTTSQQRDIFLGVYGALGFGQVLLVSAMSLVLKYSAMKATRNLHHGLLVNIMHLPMQFFETTPLGRIVNRLSRDINSVDDKIPKSLGMFLRTFLTTVGTIVIISYSTPLFLTCVLPLGALYVFIQRAFVATSRQLRRLESVSRSPIYNHFFETINGTSTIRAYSQQQRFITEIYRRMDESQVAHYPAISANRWLALRLEFIGAAILFFAALFAVIARETIAPGLVGLSVAYALQITGSLNWMVRQSSELETNIVSVERIKEYSAIAREAEWIIPSHRPPSDWPHQGRVEIEHFDMRYREQLPLVLKDINCTIGAREKVGIVGRTGAGKSTLTLALFRILERAGGRILIDGVDISKIGLQDLRSRLTIIPQDPMLFSGSLRLNLDPFNKYSDEELWDVLEVAHLKSFVSGLDKGLEFVIQDGGENLSVGQRQLVCLGRALLRKSKILILDEATAAVDLETDELIQQTIRREFADRTVFTIAHRLNTIMDYERVMVLKDGSVSEFDSPSNLLSRRGMFYSMARDAGLA